MKPPAAKRTFTSSKVAQGTDASTATIDGLASILFAYIILVGLIVLEFDATYFVTFVALPALAYAALGIVGPLFKSRPLVDPQVSQLIEDGGIIIRESRTVSTRALDTGFRKYIIFNSEDLKPPFNEWRAIVGHELEHLRQGDSRYFHFAAVSGAAAAAICIFFALSIGLTFLIEPNLSIEGIGQWPYYTVPLLLIVTLLLFVLWVRQSLHEREFRADRAGMKLNPTAFMGWLNRETLIENETSSRTSEILQRLSRWFTHPSFRRRKAALEEDPTNYSNSVSFDIVVSLLFFFGSAFLAGLTGSFFFNAEIENFSVPREFAPFLIAFTLFVLLLPMSAGVGVISVCVMKRILLQGTWGAFQFLLVLAISAIACVVVFTVIVRDTGFYQAVTADLPDVELNSVAYEAFGASVIFLNYAFLMLAPNLLVARHLPKFSFKLPIHLLVGFIAPIGMFLLTKLQWGIWGNSFSWG